MSSPDWTDVNTRLDVRDAVLDARLKDPRPSVHELTLREIRKRAPALKRPKIPRLLEQEIEEEMGRLQHRIAEGIRRCDEAPRVVETRPAPDKLHLHYSMEDLSAAMGRAIAAQIRGAIAHATAPLSGNVESNGTSHAPARPRILIAGFLPQQCQDLSSAVSSAGVELIALDKSAEVSRPLPDKVDGVVFMCHVSHAGYDRMKKKYAKRGINPIRVEGTTQAAAEIRRLANRLVPA